MPTTEITNGTRAIVKVGRNEIEVIVLEATEDGWRVRATRSGREFEVREITRVIEEPEEAMNFDLATGELRPLEPPASVQEAVGQEEATDGTVETETAPVEEQVAEPAIPAQVPAQGTAPVQGARPLSLLNAAAVVLETSDEPMRIGPLMDAILERGLWTPSAGRTPIQSLYAAIFREIKTKGDNARFLKLERGLFAFRR